MALEKIWDGFERIKTFYDPTNKKNSAQTLVTNIAAGTAEFEDLLDTEFKALTNIGNKYPEVLKFFMLILFSFCRTADTPSPVAAPL